MEKMSKKFLERSPTTQMNQTLLKGKNDYILEWESDL